MSDREEVTHVEIYSKLKNLTDRFNILSERVRKLELDVVDKLARMETKQNLIYAVLVMTSAGGFATYLLDKIFS